MVNVVAPKRLRVERPLGVENEASVGPTGPNPEGIERESTISEYIVGLVLKVSVLAGAIRPEKGAAVVLSLSQALATREVALVLSSAGSGSSARAEPGSINPAVRKSARTAVQYRFIWERSAL